MAASTTTRDADRKSQERARARDLTIPGVLDPIRRKACEEDDEEWLRVYCSDVFYNPFTPHQKRIIADCREALLYGTQKCKAAPRGDGKSSIVKYLALKYTLTRQLMFPLIIAATSSKAKKSLESLKLRLAKKEDTPLSQDYPLECLVARYINPAPIKARNVTAKRRHINVEWKPELIVIPTWDDEEPIGPIILSLGITSDDLQGCNIYDRRPDFVMLDDLDSRDSLASEAGVVAGKIEETVDKSIAGLGGQSRRLGKFMLCTITSRDAAAFKYSDPKIKPSWAGERIAAIKAWPERTDLWMQYIELRHYGSQTFSEDGQPIDPFGRQAHAFYVENRAAMDAGAELANPYNFEPFPLPDGTPKHVSALQKCYDFIADQGMDSFLTEYQNDPPEDEGLSDSGINTTLIQKQVSGFDRGIVPEDIAALVHGVDIGKLRIHWVVRAFMKNGTGFTIDYGYQTVLGTKHKSDVGLDAAIKREVLRRIEEFRDMPYAKAFRDSLTLVDSGYRSEAVYAACVEAGMGVMPVKGIGLSSSGEDRMKFTDVMRRTQDKIPVCDGVYKTKIRDKDIGTFELVCASSDQWKAWEHDRWLTAADKPGCMFLFGLPSDDPRYMSPDQRDHATYAMHICAEREVEEFTPQGLKRRWKQFQKDNHWLDASYYANVAAAIKGVRLLGASQQQAPVLSLAALQKAKT